LTNACITESTDSTESTVHALITSADGGNRSAANTLFEKLYTELHRLARRELAKQQSPAFGVTSLLHEVYVAMARRDDAVFPDRGRFMAYAARVMRGLIIDDVRYRQAQKRGGGKVHLTTLHTNVAQHAVVNAEDLASLSDALDELALHDAALAELVDLRYFCGFTFEEIGALRGVSDRTVKRQWQKARVYLRRALGETDLETLAQPCEDSTPIAGGS
jgi:RNA polymerase sigma factor (TIGR02999 family)